MINVTINEGQNNKNEKPFPKLMTQKGTSWIMWFVNRNTCFHIKGTYQGAYTDHYKYDSETVDYNEPITIQNA